MFEFPKERYFDEKALGKKSTRDESLVRLLESPAMMADSLKKKSSSKAKETDTWFLSSDPNEFFVRLNSLL